MPARQLAATIEKVYCLIDVTVDIKKRKESRLLYCRKFHAFTLLIVVAERSPREP